MIKEYEWSFNLIKTFSNMNERTLTLAPDIMVSNLVVFIIWSGVSWQEVAAASKYWIIYFPQKIQSMIKCATKYVWAWKLLRGAAALSFIIHSLVIKFNALDIHRHNEIVGLLAKSKLPTLLNCMRINYNTLTLYLSSTNTYINII